MRIRAELCCVGQRDSPGYMREKEKLRTRRSSTLFLSRVMQEPSPRLVTVRSRNLRRAGVGYIHGEQPVYNR